jgi:hypothetical protein
VLAISLARRNTPPQALQIIGAAGAFSALSFIFASPLIAAVILIEATGIGGPRLRLILLPGLLAAGIGTLVSLGIGSFTGLSTSAMRYRRSSWRHSDIRISPSSAGRSRSRSLSRFSPASWSGVACSPTSSCREGR